MLFERRNRDRAGPSATELGLEELIAQQPRRGAAANGAGRRGPLGERPGRGRSQSLDFDGIAIYAPGDDIRHIDWRATARSGKAMVRHFAAHSHRARLIIADLHPHLYFGTQTRLMSKTIALMAARLAWESHGWDEPVGLMVPGALRLKPRTGRRRLMRNLDSLCAAYRTPVAKPPSLAKALEEAAADLQHGDEICVVSDFGADVEELVNASGPLSETCVLKAYLVDDPIARTPPPSGRYPSILSGDGTRQTFTVSGGDLTPKLLEARGLRRRLLLDHNWQVAEVADLLPETAEGPR